jgi:cytochrome b561/polyisoprenoid-binding protein YceI
MATDDSASTESGPLTSDQVRYSTGAIVLHWLLALAMAFQIALGFAMPQQGPYSFAPMQLHKSIGISILLLTLIRLAWRLVRRPPEAVEQGWMAMAARSVHWAFYAVLMLGPLTGWIIVSTARLHVPTVLFGVLPWPHLPLPASLNGPMGEVHEALAWIAIVLFVLHVAGALRHQFLLRDPVITRIAPAGSVTAAMVLLLTSVVIYFAVGSYVAQKYLVPAMAEFRAARGREAAPPAPASALAAPPSQAASPALEPTGVPTAGAAGRPPVWSIVGGKRLVFSVGNGGTQVEGRFKEWSGSIAMDPDHPQTADIRISVKLASASVGDATQDAMLQGADFFASASNPTATWRSTKVMRTGPGRYHATGMMTLRGKSRPQAIAFTLTGDKLERHVKGSASLDRTAFGIGGGEAGESLSKTVALTFSFDAVGKAP